MNWKFKIKNILELLFIVLSLTACLTEDETNELKFKPVTVVTAAVTSVTTNSAVTGGTIAAPQQRNVVRGVCWSTNPNPEITLSTKTTNGTGLGSFSSSITGLAANTTYYVRAYATSSLSTVYGNQAIVKTSMPVLATVSTNAVSAITSTIATCGGNITSDGGATVTARGVCWSSSENPTITNSNTSNGTGTGEFTSSLSGLVAGTTYYVRAYATNIVGTVYGTQQTFSTTNLPTLTTIAVSSINTVSAIGGGNISSDGGSTILSCGVCWSTNSNPTTANSTATASGIGFGFTGGYTVTLTILLPSTTYYVRAFATNGVGTAYGNQISFTTSPIITLPIISTTSATSITTTTANSGGNITSDGGAIVTVRGVCWSTSSNPTITNSKTSNSSGTGSFTSSITGLSAGTIYYVRAYATNSVGTAYGSQVSFSTTSITLPTITTTAITAISTSGCSSGGNITSDGGSTVTAKGVCWSTSTNPTILNSKTSNGTGTSVFTSSLTGLSAGTTYYVRAYATNSMGTAYGSQVSFSTSSIILPTISTTAISAINTSGCTTGGSISSDGGATITARGVCWSTLTNPTTSNSKTSGGTGTGSFISSISGLSSGTTYYVRAYATNSVGTAYGSQVNFTTTSITLPTISTTVISSISTSGCSTGGSISSDGGASVTTRGVCWSTSTNPTISNSKTSDGIGIGSFTSSISGLTAGTTYYVRAYATNSAGTAYGSVYSFKTNSPYTIGQSYQGGIIFYIDGTGLHGLICATSNQSGGLRWYDGYVQITGAADSSVGSGNANTTKIVNTYGTGSYAARVCYDLFLNGYSDWYLPSRDELNLMYNNLNVLNVGDFSNQIYWSSTEYSSSQSYYLSFGNGLYNIAAKSSTFYVRAIRAF